MSFAMDDLSGSYGVDHILQKRLIEETHSADGKSETKDTSDSAKKEPEVNDVYEKTQQKQELVKKTYDDVQTKSTAIDITKESLDKIASHVEEVKKIIESDSSSAIFREKIDENYKEIKQTAKDSSFNNHQLIEENNDPSQKAISLEEMKITDIEKMEAKTSEQKKAAADKLNEIMQNIQDKKEELVEKQEKLAQSINKNSLVELKLNTSPEETEKVIEKPKEIAAEDMKESAIKEIYKNPEKNLQVHIKHIDRNLLLAMLSLRMA